MASETMIFSFISFSLFLYVYVYVYILSISIFLDGILQSCFLIYPFYIAFIDFIGMVYDSKSSIGWAPDTRQTLLLALRIPEATTETNPWRCGIYSQVG